MKWESWKERGCLCQVRDTSCHPPRITLWQSTIPLSQPSCDWLWVSYIHSILFELKLFDTGKQFVVSLNYCLFKQGGEDTILECYSEDGVNLNDTFAWDATLVKNYEVLLCLGLTTRGNKLKKLFECQESCKLKLSNVCHHFGQADCHWTLKLSCHAGTTSSPRTSEMKDNQGVNMSSKADPEFKLNGFNLALNSLYC